MARRDAGNRHAARRAVAVRVADGYATPVAGAFSETAPVSPASRRRRGRARAPPRSPRSRLGARARAVLPTKPCSDRIRSDRARMKPKTTAARRRRRPRRRRWRWRREVPSRTAPPSRRRPADVSIVARAPDGMLLRVWLHGEAEDEDEDDADADGGTASASANAPAVFVLDDASKNGDFFARSEPVALTCAFPFAVAAPRGGTREKLARAVDLTGLAPGDSHVLALGMSGDGARENRGEARTAENRETRLLIAGAPRGAALGRATTETTRWKTGTATGVPVPGVGERAARRARRHARAYRARSTRERVVALAVAGRLEEAVALADARGGDVPPLTFDGSDASSSPSFAVLTRASAVSSPSRGWTSSSPRRCGAPWATRCPSPSSFRTSRARANRRTAFRGRVEASAVGAGAETDEKRFVRRLGARETVSAFSRPGAPCLADLETVVAAHASRPEPREVGRLCRDASARSCRSSRRDPRATATRASAGWTRSRCASGRRRATPRGWRGRCSGRRRRKRKRRLRRGRTRKKNSLSRRRTVATSTSPCSAPRARPAGVISRARSCTGAWRETTTPRLRRTPRSPAARSSRRPPRGQ